MEAPKKVVLICGNIGNGSIVLPQVIEGLDSVVTIVSSPPAHHSLIICEDGKCYAIGRNTHGQLGMDGESANSPKLIKALEKHKIVKGSVGRNHSLFLSDQGVVFGCGKNDLLEVGHPNRKGKSTNIESPIEILALKEKKIVDIASGGHFNIALDSDGNLWSWGSQENGCTGTGSDRASIGAGKASFGTHLPQKIASLEGTKIKKVVCGTSHTVALSEAGDVYTWGFGGYGRLGHKDQKDEFKPKKIDSKIFIPVSDIAAGNQYNLAIGGHGILYTWGKIKSSGDSIMYPTQERDLGGWKIGAMSCGATSACVVGDPLSTAKTIGWGQANEGELGFGDQKSSAKPKIIEPLAGIVVKSIACGYSHTLFLAEKNEKTDLLKKFTGEEIESESSEEVNIESCTICGQDILPSKNKAIAKVVISCKACQGKAHNACIKPTLSVPKRKDWLCGNCSKQPPKKKQKTKK